MTIRAAEARRNRWGKGGGSIRGGEKVGIPSSYFGFPSPRAWISFLLIWKTFFRGLAGLEPLPLRSRTGHAPEARLGAPMLAGHRDERLPHLSVGTTLP
jgi:hypothetical protein